ncbi:MAG TPA: cytochrome c oxidase subunit 3 [Gemmatimonadales bacterium]
MATLRITPTASPARTGVWIGIATITMSFAAYTSALVVRQGASPDWQHFRMPPILYVNTLLLLLSSGTLELGRARVRWSWVEQLVEGRSVAGPRGISWLYATLALGLLFVAGQFVAWHDLAGQGLYLATNPSSAFFYIFTVLHALHLLGGIVALGYVIHRVRPLAGGPPDGPLGAAALYWHFMDVLWLYLLLVLVLRL